MRTIHPPRAGGLIVLAFLFSLFLAPAQAAIVFGTITFDAAGLAEQLVPGPFVETVAGVTMTLTSPAHIHNGDWSDDGNPDLYNHANIVQTLTFSKPVSTLGFDVVDEDGGLGANNTFVSSAGGTFNVNALGVFDVAASGVGIWEEITAFSWTQPGGDLTIDNLQFSAVPLPAAFWLGIAGLAALSRFARQRKCTPC